MFYEGILLICVFIRLIVIKNMIQKTTKTFGKKNAVLSTAVIFFSGIYFTQAQQTQPVKDSALDLSLIHI